MKVNKVFLRTAGAVGIVLREFHGEGPRGQEGTIDAFRPATSTSRRPRRFRPRRSTRRRHGCRPRDRAAAADVVDMGKLEMITERYPDGKVKVEREVGQDAAGNYFNQGTYKLYSPNGEVIKSGEFLNGKQHGKWTQQLAKDEGHLFSASQDKQWTGPFTSEATFQDGRLHGTWTIKDSRGQTHHPVELRQRHPLRHVDLVASQRPETPRSDLRQRRPERRRARVGPRRQDRQPEQLHRRQVRRQGGRVVHAWPEAFRGDLPPRLRHAGSDLRLVEQQDRHRRPPPPSARTSNTASGPSGIPAATRRPRGNTTTASPWASSPGGTRTARSRPKASTRPARRPAPGSPGIPTA